MDRFEIDKILKEVPIDLLDFSKRTYKLLKRQNINSLYDLVNNNFQELKQIKNVYTTTLDEILSKVHLLGLSFKDEELDDDYNKLLNFLKTEKQYEEQILQREKNIRKKVELLEKYKRLNELRNKQELNSDKKLNSEIDDVLRQLSEFKSKKR